MKLKGDYTLPVSEQPSDYEYESPLHVVERKLYFAMARFEHATETRAKHRGRRGEILTVYTLDLDSGGIATADAHFPRLLLPGRWSFIQDGERLFLHCGHLLSVAPDFRTLDLAFTTPQAVKGASRPNILVLDGNVIIADEKQQSLQSFSLAQEKPKWQLDLRGTKPYSIGAPQTYGAEITCYGRDCLNFLHPADGSIRKSIRFPRLDKLYSPLPIEDDLILGYTNWSAGGVVRYAPSDQKVQWQYRKRFSGPGTYCQIHRIGSVIVWVKGETETIGIDMNTGQEMWAYQATPWLYTQIGILDGDLIFGTAGRDGYLQRVDAATGKARWLFFLKNGCSYFDYYQDSIIVGDFDRCLRRVRLSDGQEIDRLQVDGRVVGDVKTADHTACTVIWSDREGKKPPRLILVNLT